MSNTVKTSNVDTDSIESKTEIHDDSHTDLSAQATSVDAELEKNEKKVDGEDIDLPAKKKRRVQEGEQKKKEIKENLKHDEKLKEQQKSMLDIQRKAKEQSRSKNERSRRRREAFEQVIRKDVEADVKTTKKLKKGHDVLSRMENKMAQSGPMRILYDCVKDGIKAKVYIRRYKGLRGIITGYIVAFDTHMNLAMIDIEETYSIETWMIGEPLKKKIERKKKNVLVESNMNIESDINTQPFQLANRTEPQPLQITNGRDTKLLPVANRTDTQPLETTNTKGTQPLETRSRMNSSNIPSLKTLDILKKVTEKFKGKSMIKIDTSAFNVNNDIDDIDTLQQHISLETENPKHSKSENSNHSKHSPMVSPAYALKHPFDFVSTHSGENIQKENIISVMYDAFSSQLSKNNSKQIHDHSLYTVLQSQQQNPLHDSFHEDYSRNSSNNKSNKEHMQATALKSKTIMDPRNRNKPSDIKERQQKRDKVAPRTLRGENEMIDSIIMNPNGTLNYNERIEESDQDEEDGFQEILPQLCRVSCRRSHTNQLKSIKSNQSNIKQHKLRNQSTGRKTPDISQSTHRNILFNQTRREPSVISKTQDRSFDHDYTRKLPPHNRVPYNKLSKANPGENQLVLKEATISPRKKLTRSKSLSNLNMSSKSSNYSESLTIPTFSNFVATPRRRRLSCHSQTNSHERKDNLATPAFTNVSTAAPRTRKLSCHSQTKSYENVTRHSNVFNSKLTPAVVKPKQNLMSTHSSNTDGKEPINVKTSIQKVRADRSLSTERMAESMHKCKEKSTLQSRQQSNKTILCPRTSDSSTCKGNTVISAVSPVTSLQVESQPYVANTRLNTSKQPCSSGNSLQIIKANRIESDTKHPIASSPIFDIAMINSCLKFIKDSELAKHEGENKSQLVKSSHTPHGTFYSTHPPQDTPYSTNISIKDRESVKNQHKNETKIANSTQAQQRAFHLTRAPQDTPHSINCSVKDSELVKNQNKTKNAMADSSHAPLDTPHSTNISINDNELANNRDEKKTVIVESPHAPLDALHSTNISINDNELANNRDEKKTVIVESPHVPLDALHSTNISINDNELANNRDEKKTVIVESPHAPLDTLHSTTMLMESSTNETTSSDACIDQVVTTRHELSFETKETESTTYTNSFINDQTSSTDTITNSSNRSHKTSIWYANPCVNLSVCQSVGLPATEPFIKELKNSISTTSSPNISTDAVERPSSYESNKLLSTTNNDDMLTSKSMTFPSSKDVHNLTVNERQIELSIDHCISSLIEVAHRNEIASDEKNSDQTSFSTSEKNSSEKKLGTPSLKNHQEATNKSINEPIKKRCVFGYYSIASQIQKVKKCRTIPSLERKLSQKLNLNINPIFEDTTIKIESSSSEDESKNNCETAEKLAAKNLLDKYFVIPPECLLEERSGKDENIKTQKTLIEKLQTNIPKKIRNNNTGNLTQKLGVKKSTIRKKIKVKNPRTRNALSGNVPDTSIILEDKRMTDYKNGKPETEKHLIKNIDIEVETLGYEKSSKHDFQSLIPSNETCCSVSKDETTESGCLLEISPEHENTSTLREFNDPPEKINCISELALPEQNSHDVHRISSTAPFDDNKLPLETPLDLDRCSNPTTYSNTILTEKFSEEECFVNNVSTKILRHGEHKEKRNSQVGRSNLEIPLVDNVNIVSETTSMEESTNLMDSHCMELDEDQLGKEFKSSINSLEYSRETALSTMIKFDVPKDSEKAHMEECNIVKYADKKFEDMDLSMTEPKDEFQVCPEKNQIAEFKNDENPNYGVERIEAFGNEKPGEFKKTNVEGKEASGDLKKTNSEKCETTIKTLRETNLPVEGNDDDKHIETAKVKTVECRNVENLNNNEASTNSQSKSAPLEECKNLADPTRKLKELNSPIEVCKKVEYVDSENVYTEECKNFEYPTKDENDVKSDSKGALAKECLNTAAEIDLPMEVCEDDNYTDPEKAHVEECKNLPGSTEKLAEIDSPMEVCKNEVDSEKSYGVECRNLKSVAEIPTENKLPMELFKNNEDLVEESRDTESSDKQSRGRDSTRQTCGDESHEKCGTGANIFNNLQDIEMPKEVNKEVVNNDSKEIHVEECRTTENSNGKLEEKNVLTNVCQNEVNHTPEKINMEECKTASIPEIDGSNKTLTENPRNAVSSLEYETKMPLIISNDVLGKRSVEESSEKGHVEEIEVTVQEDSEKEEGELSDSSCSDTPEMTGTSTHKERRLCRTRESQTKSKRHQKDQKSNVEKDKKASIADRKNAPPLNKDAKTISRSKNRAEQLLVGESSSRFLDADRCENTSKMTRDEKPRKTDNDTSHRSKDRSEKSRSEYHDKSSDKNSDERQCRRDFDAKPRSKDSDTKSRDKDLDEKLQKTSLDAKPRSKDGDQKSLDKDFDEKLQKTGLDAKPRSKDGDQRSLVRDFDEKLQKTSLDAKPRSKDGDQKSLVRDYNEKGFKDGDKMHFRDDDIKRRNKDLVEKSYPKDRDGKGYNVEKPGNKDCDDKQHDREHRDVKQRNRERVERPRSKDHHVKQRDREGDQRPGSKDVGNKQRDRERDDRPPRKDRDDRERDEKPRSKGRHDKQHDKERDDRLCSKDSGDKRHDRERDEKPRSKDRDDRERDENPLSKERCDKQRDRERDERPRSKDRDDRERDERPRKDCDDKQRDRERDERPRSKDRDNRERDERPRSKDRDVRERDERPRKDCDDKQRDRECDERLRSKDRGYRERDENSISKDRDDKQRDRERDERPRSKDRDNKGLDIERDKRLRSKDRDDKRRDRERDERPRSTDLDDKKPDERPRKDRDDKQRDRERDERPRSKDRDNKGLDIERDKRLRSKDRDDKRRDRERDERPRSTDLDDKKPDERPRKDRDDKQRDRERDERPRSKDSDDKQRDRERDGRPRSKDHSDRERDESPLSKDRGDKQRDRERDERPRSKVSDDKRLDRERDERPRKDRDDKQHDRERDERLRSKDSDNRELDESPRSKDLNDKQRDRERDERPRSKDRDDKRRDRDAKSSSKKSNDLKLRGDQDARSHKSDRREHPIRTDRDVKSRNKDQYKGLKNKNLDEKSRDKGERANSKRQEDKQQQRYKDGRSYHESSRNKDHNKKRGHDAKIGPNDEKSVDIDRDDRQQHKGFTEIVSSSKKEHDMNFCIKESAEIEARREKGNESPSIINNTKLDNSNFKQESTIVRNSAASSSKDHLMDVDDYTKNLYEREEEQASIFSIFGNDNKKVGTGAQEDVSAAGRSQVHTEKSEHNMRNVDIDDFFFDQHSDDTHSNADSDFEDIEIYDFQEPIIQNFPSEDSEKTGEKSCEVFSEIEPNSKKETVDLDTNHYNDPHKNALPKNFEPPKQAVRVITEETSQNSSAAEDKEKRNTRKASSSSLSQEKRSGYESCPERRRKNMQSRSRNNPDVLKQNDKLTSLRNKAHDAIHSVDDAALKAVGNVGNTPRSLTRNAGDTSYNTTSAVDDSSRKTFSDLRDKLKSRDRLRDNKLPGGVGKKSGRSRSRDALHRRKGATRIRDQSSSSESEKETKEERRPKEFNIFQKRIEKQSRKRERDGSYKPRQYGRDGKTEVQHKPRDQKRLLLFNQANQESFLMRRQREKERKSQQVLEKEKENFENWLKFIEPKTLHDYDKPEHGKIFKRRYANQIFVRGDNIIMIAYDKNDR